MGNGQCFVLRFTAASLHSFLAVADSFHCCCARTALKFVPLQPGREHGMNLFHQLRCGCTSFLLLLRCIRLLLLLLIL